MSKVSVIITAYNEEDNIFGCLASLQLQLQKSMEIIVVDNGSTDLTYETAKLVPADRYKPIRVYKLKENRGPGGGRNYGASKAKGDILCFLDADMVFDNKYIQKLVEPIVKGKQVGTFHGREIVANIRNKWARAWSLERVVDPPEYGGVFRAIDKEAFLGCGGFNNSKGYFDDELDIQVQSYCVRDAVCYHKNPSTLKEAYNHSKWVGRSLDKGTLKTYLNKYIFPVSFIGLTYILVIGSLFNSGVPIINIINYILSTLTGGIVGLLLLSGISKAIKEKYISHLLYVPILNAVKYYGYLRGYISK